PAYEDTEAALARNKQEMKQDIKTRKKLIKKIKTALEA
ncbi:TPA: HK97 family phage prohead protease, partial [Enterococcus faecalis]